MEQRPQARIIEVCSWPCSNIEEKYEVSQDQLGKGTYGSVYKAYHRERMEHFALKKMQNIEQKGEYGFPITTFRQIRLLQRISHPNILNINEVVYQKQRNSKPVIYLCLDLMQCDLSLLIRTPSYKMTCWRIQNIMRQILEGLSYLNDHGIAHRDIKPSNILINWQGQVKLADFGLAKQLTKLSTLKVVTLWYRAPQLLLGIRNYTPKIDIWSVGCVAAELLLRRPLFESEKIEKQLIKRMFRLLGTPDQNLQEEIKNNEQYLEVKPDYTATSEIVPHLKTSAVDFEGEDQLIDLIEKMLRINPHSRLTARECLQHEFLTNVYPNEDPLLPNYVFEKKRGKDYEGEDQTRKKVKM